MAEHQGQNTKLPNLGDFSHSLADLAQQSQTLVNDFLRQQAACGHLTVDDVSRVGAAFVDMTRKMMADPAKLVAAQMALWRNRTALRQNSPRAWLGLGNGSEGAEPSRGCEHPDWQDSYLFGFVKQAYLLTVRWLQVTMSGVEGIDTNTRKKLEFYTRQFANALVPANFPVTRPDVAKAALESGGCNIVQGLRHLLRDLERGAELLLRPEVPFKTGENLAATASKVVYQNELMQLLQYEPRTPRVFARPLLVVPSWLTKYYVLDLRPRYSLIRWLLDQGFSVFVISWVNPDAALAGKGFDDYLGAGPLAALDAIAAATGESQVNAIGYSSGGILLACATAILAAKADNRINSTTYLTTLLDFARPGELEIFIDEEQITALSKREGETGLLNGADMAVICSMLRANDLIWSYFVNSYLPGREPFPFDLLHWNADYSTVTAAMQGFYLRNLYQRNLLKQPGGLRLGGQSIDLSRVRVPAYFVAAEEDHITPWRSVYAGTRLASGRSRFVLGGAGHVAGIVTPPGGNDLGYRVNVELGADPNVWFEGAEKRSGSWWLDWLDWMRQCADRTVPARVPGVGGLAVIEAGPGGYVRGTPGRGKPQRGHKPGDSP